MISNKDFLITDHFFKVILISSLPPLWDTFTDPYSGGRKGVIETDPKKLMSLQELISILKEEYLQRQVRTAHTDSVNLATQQKPSLAKCLGMENDQSTMHTKNFSKRPRRPCTHCGKHNHVTDKCKFLGKPKCTVCHKFSHMAKDCWNRPGKRRPENENTSASTSNGKKQKIEETHISIEGARIKEIEDEIVFNAEENVQSVVDEDEDEIVTACIGNGDNEMILWYNWLADSATTSHIANRRETFSEYESLTNISVAGVGRSRTPVVGHGTILLETICKGHRYNLQLEHILHIPSNRNNLLSLGQWDNAGGSYASTNSILHLTTKSGKIIAEGKQIPNNLYKMNVDVKSVPQKSEETYTSTENLQSWETWHRRFRHVSYTGLQKLLEENLVDSFNVDIHMPKPNCIACTEAKLAIEPYKRSNDWHTTPGELTHTNLWGKYDTKSINNNQYYILFVDDTSQYMTTKFLKGKDEAAQAVKDYMTYLTTHGKSPSALQMDWGKEFLNILLTQWCSEHGIDNQVTALYSPSQNGIAKCANRTLVELARTMIRGQNLPEFLWEQAISYATYVRNCSYTRTLKGTTPYELWFQRKPYVVHLREFSTPVWVLLQGQAIEHKLLPKSQQQAYVGYEEGPKAIKYYNVEM